MNPVRAALHFVRRHGVVLEAGAGPVPNLAEAVAGSSATGAWWSHPKGRLIFKLTRAVREEHTSSGRHRLVTVPYPAWLPADLPAISDEDARSALGPVVSGRSIRRTT